MLCELFHFYFALLTCLSLDSLLFAIMNDARLYTKLFFDEDRFLSPWEDCLKSEAILYTDFLTS